MNRKRKIAATALATVVAASGMTVATAPVANALPSCMNVYQNKISGTIQINAGKCGKTKWVKVIWAFGPDSACKAVIPYKYNSYKKPWKGARYDGAKSC